MYMEERNVKHDNKVSINVHEEKGVEKPDDNYNKIHREARG